MASEEHGFVAIQTLVFRNHQEKGNRCQMESSQFQLSSVALPRNQNFVNLIVENCEDCLAILNLEGQVVWANTIAQREWGIDEESSSDCLTWTRGWPNDSRDQIDEAICSARETGIGRFRAMRPLSNGSACCWNVIVKRVHLTEEDTVGLLVSGRDISDSNPTVSSLLTSESTSADDSISQRGQLTETCHDMRNCLAAILGYAQFLSAKSNEETEVVAAIRRNSETLLSLVDAVEELPDCRSTLLSTPTQAAGDPLSAVNTNGEMDHRESESVEAEFAEFDPRDVEVDSNRESRPMENGISAVFRPKALQVLIVDDRRDIRQIASRLVEKEGGFAILAESGCKAFEAIAQRQRSGESIDLVFMDVIMPGTGGIETVRKMRCDGFQKPIVAITGNATEMDRKAYLAAGCTDVLGKPFHAKDFVGLLRRYGNDPASIG